VGARAAGAHAGQLDVCRVSGDVEQLDVAAVGLHEGSNPIQHCFYAFSGDHGVSKGNGHAMRPVTDSRKTRDFSKD
jgi:hypothetical protein